MNTIDLLGISLVLIALLAGRIPLVYLPVVFVTISGALMVIMTKTRRRPDR